LSGYQYNAVRFFGSPFQILGPPVGGDDSAAFFPGTGSLVGGILPALGRFGQPIDFPSSAFSPGGAGASQVRGLGPLFQTIYPSYSPEFPFFGEVDFQGFDGLGRPVFGPRESSNGSGDIFIGTKVNLIDANKHWFSMALGGYLKIPISSGDDARARGRTSGEYEYGPFLAFGQENGSHRFRLYENIGYIHTTDPRDHDVKYLDLHVGGAEFAHRRRCGNRPHEVRRQQHAAIDRERSVGSEPRSALLLQGWPNLVRRRLSALLE
jgi:hypothetical protein